MSKTDTTKHVGEKLAVELGAHLKYGTDSVGKLHVWISDEGKDLIVKTIDEACGESYMDGVRHEQKQ
jgi:hypothetical protein